ncbi:hypothetical protein CRUP_012065 [Coryphaenoides rupestris]|nr:hypothetical protein CRUP_012065 [Coryphaenoides rupestris]
MSMWAVGRRNPKSALIDVISSDYVAIIALSFRPETFDGRFGVADLRRTHLETMRWCHGSLLHLLCCLRLRACTRACRVRPPARLRELWAYPKLLLQSLQYNSLTNSDVVFDSVFEPVFWTVDRITRWFGAVFVFLVVVLTSSILLICYTILLPMVIATYPTGWVVWHLCYGHWNLVMIVFNYYKAVKNDIPFVSVCKKCIIPKPARTHHCGISWLNNCVGHLNHRYFFCFCLSMALGCMYCTVSGRNLFLDAYNALEVRAVAVALGGLTIWHAVLISRGETSIERHTNFKETTRLAKRGKVYKNPFNYGRINNWKVFFGVQKKSHWLTRVLLPSGHVPPSDGLTWDVLPCKKDTIPV